jgi:Rrf2 family protein
MQFSAQEEYGLRCLLRIATEGADRTLTIPEISQAEGLSIPYVAKMMRVLRRGGVVISTRGQSGGYRLSRPAGDISVAEALTVLGGRLFEGEFCERHSGTEDLCTHSVNCSIRSLWRSVQSLVDQLLRRTTLQDMLCDEKQMDAFVSNLVAITSNIQTQTKSHRLN